MTSAVTNFTTAKGDANACAHDANTFGSNANK